MKKILLLLLITITIVSCEVMDVEPQDAINASEAFKNKDDIDKGILGAYATFQSLSYYGRTYHIFSDLSADNLSHPVDATAIAYAEVDNNHVLPENSSVSGIWSIIYDGLNVVNNVIVKVPEIADMSDEQKDVALGELYFLRALNHFNLLNYFGAIPLKVEPTVGVNNLDVARDPVNDVYAKIIEDLNFAIEHLAVSGNKTRASQYAARALLSRVFLYKGDYAQAASMATEVIESGNYGMTDNYDDVFAQDQSQESIFEIYFSEVERNRIAEYNFPKTLNGRREVEPSESLLNAYETGDERYSASIAFDGTNAYSIKYDDLSKGADNVIILRLAEMFLIRAEAEAKLSGDILSIQNDINKIRLRANLPATTETSYDKLLKIIENERRLEFAFEGHRWFDLVRTGRAIAVLPNVNNINQTLFPIPLDEMQANNNPGMTQNPGY